MRDFIQKKREMFIVGMLIQDKEEEITKMTRECDREEEKLRVEFEALDAERRAHDDRVQMDHQQQQEQTRKAEREAELLSKKNKEQKRLEQQKLIVEADIGRMEVNTFYLLFLPYKSHFFLRLDDRTRAQEV